MNAHSLQSPLRWPSTPVGPLVRFLSMGSFLALLAAPGHAAELFPSDGNPRDYFGDSVSVWGLLGVVGAAGHDTGFSSHPVTEGGQGMAYLYRELDRAAGRVPEASKLLASDGRSGDNFGRSVSLHGTSCLIGAPGVDKNGIRSIGTVYLFRDLDEAGPWVTETATLLPPASLAHRAFGTSVGLWRGMGVVGAPYEEVEGHEWQGAAHLFHHLDTAEGVLVPSVTLLASDGQENDTFGETVVMGEIGALISASGARAANENHRTGAVYLFRDLEAVTAGVLTETAKLVAAGDAWFLHPRFSLSLCGSNALIKSGSRPTPVTNIMAWLFRDLDRATGEVAPSVRLTTSKSKRRIPYDSVSLSGDAAVVADSFEQAAYLYVNLGAAEGEVGEAVRLVPSRGGGAFGWWNYRVSLNGDVFLIGDPEMVLGDRKEVGTAYCGRISAFTMVDEGEAEREISFLSFDSRVDWIIGAVTSGNRLTLGVGDEATVTDPGKAVYLGKEAGANDNTLTLAGRLTATEVFIGAVAGNRGNTLHLAKPGVVLDAALRLAPENFLTLEGDHAAPHALSERLGTAKLHVWDGALWQAVDIYNHTELVKASYDAETDLTTVASVQEPITMFVPTLSLTVTGAPGQLQLRVSGAPDSAWVLQRSDDLTEWEDLQTLTLDAAGLATITGLPAPAGAVFYRCVLVP